MGRDVDWIATASWLLPLVGAATKQSRWTFDRTGAISGHCAHIHSSVEHVRMDTQHPLGVSALWKVFDALAEHVLAYKRHPLI